ncbi:MAG: hypothetical protein LBM95_10040 [Lactobacillales bacterium]|jgi:hypothetical protein|nr:hypothetical protein [Lactobacillales bacterium]
MKKYLIPLLFMLMGVNFLIGEKTQAASRENKSDLNITFMQGEDEIPVNHGAKEPFEPQDTLPGMEEPSSTGEFPSTGELITSVTWMLIGFSLLIVVVVIFSYKSLWLRPYEGG